MQNEEECRCCYNDAAFLSSLCILHFALCIFLMAFNFHQPRLLADDQLQLHLRVTESAEESIRKVLTYRFDIHLKTTAGRIGHINLRVGETDLIKLYIGHIGYGIDEPHRGHHYAERACRILLPFAKENGLQTIWITCAPDNAASQRTLERLGAEFVGIFDLPADYPLPPGAIRQNCRYRMSCV
jgi:tagatose 1,6-diphosphate aldolase